MQTSTAAMSSSSSGGGALPAARSSSMLMRPLPRAPITAIENTMWLFELERRIGPYYKHSNNVGRITQRIAAAKLAGLTRVTVPREFELSVNVTCAQLGLTYKPLAANPQLLEIDLTHFAGPPMIRSGVPDPRTCVLRSDPVTCLPCRHTCSCETCSQIISTLSSAQIIEAMNERRCPICWATIADTVYIFD